MKTNKGVFDENGDAITRGYVEPEYKIIDTSILETRIAKCNKQILHYKKEKENSEKFGNSFEDIYYSNVCSNIDKYLGIRIELEEILQQAQDITPYLEKAFQEGSNVPNYEEMTHKDCIEAYNASLKEFIKNFKL